jgi:hypothetical protein
MKYIKLTDRVTVIKDGKKILAKIIDHNSEGQKRQYRYSLEVPKLGGLFECLNIAEINELLNEFINKGELNFHVQNN